MEPLIGGMPKKLSMLGLGFSPPAEGIEAEVFPPAVKMPSCSARNA
jgi:hypothetical protein